MALCPLTDIAHDITGSGPPVLFLHGFPQTRALWKPVIAELAGITSVAADLRGYGASWKPEPGPEFEKYSFRAMGEDMFALMSALGHERFHLVGHDRGARVSYRMALDCPERVASLTVMDILPTDALVSAWDFPVSKAYFHWSYLAQPAPFPEVMILNSAVEFFPCQFQRVYSCSCCVVLACQQACNTLGGGFGFRPCRNFASARPRIRHQRSMAVNCGVVCK